MLGERLVWANATSLIESVGYWKALAFIVVVLLAWNAKGIVAEILLHKRTSKEDRRKHTRLTNELRHKMDKRRRKDVRKRERQAREDAR